MGLTEDLTNVTQVVTAVSDMTVSVLGIFMESPLVIFVGLTIFSGVVYMVKRMLHK
jgi:hypothetical protein